MADIPQHWLNSSVKNSDFRLYFMRKEESPPMDIPLSIMQAKLHTKVAKSCLCLNLPQAYPNMNTPYIPMQTTEIPGTIRGIQTATKALTVLLLTNRMEHNEPGNRISIPV